MASSYGGFDSQDLVLINSFRKKKTYYKPSNFLFIELEWRGGKKNIQVDIMIQGKIKPSGLLEG